jgi:hypothetical protein
MMVRMAAESGDAAMVYVSARHAHCAALRPHHPPALPSARQITCAPQKTRAIARHTARSNRPARANSLDAPAARRALAARRTVPRCRSVHMAGEQPPVARAWRERVRVAAAA